VNRLRTATFTVHGTTAQSARWKQAAEAEGFPSAGAWLAAAADAYLKARARAGAPIPLAWRLGRFKVRLEDGSEELVNGHLSPPFASFRGGSGGPAPRGFNVHSLVFLPSGRILATVRYYQEARALASELARLWIRGDGSEPVTDARAAESLPVRVVLP